MQRNLGSVEKCNRLNVEGAQGYLIAQNYKDGFVRNCVNYSAAGPIVNTNKGAMEFCENYGDNLSWAICNTNDTTGKIMFCKNYGDKTVGDGSYTYVTNYGAICFSNKGLVLGCVNEGEVKVRLGGNYQRGTIVANNSGTIISCYSNLVGETKVTDLVQTNSGTIIGCYNKSECSKLTTNNTGTITNSYYYDNTNGVMLDQDGIQITDTLLNLLQAANDALKDDEDYETKKVTWKVDANINEGYPSFSWETQTK